MLKINAEGGFFMKKTDELTMAMIEYFGGDAKRIQHFIKVHAFSRLIGESEGLDEKTLYILETASIVHDIGIKAAEEKYGYQNGKLQEELGPEIAQKMLEKLGFEEDVIERVCFLVSKHHTYSGVEEKMDYRILLEADFLVNFYEFGLEKRSIYAAKDVIMKTETGRKMCRLMFLE